MNRRELLAAAAATALAGCSSSDTDDATTTESRTTTGDSGTTVESDPTTVESRRTTVAGGTSVESRSTTTGSRSTATGSRSTTTGPRSGGLDIRSQAEEAYDLSFVLQVHSTGQIAYEEQKTFEPGDTFSLDSHLSARMNYRFVVLASGEELFEITVSPNETYDLVVKQGPEIEIER